MSRKVELDRPLADADRTYLRQLGSAGDHLERRIDAEFPPDAEELAAFERKHREYLSKMNGSGHTMAEQDLLLSENERLRNELAALQAQLEDRNSSNAPSYTGWSKAKLEEEVDRVNAEDPDAKLEKGKVADMVTALSAYFTTE